MLNTISGVTTESVPSKLSLGHGRDALSDIVPANHGEAMPTLQTTPLRCHAPDNTLALSGNEGHVPESSTILFSECCSEE